jgi:hypothetical protein
MCANQNSAADLSVVSRAQLRSASAAHPISAARFTNQLKVS